MANWVTLSRAPILLAIVLLLYAPDPAIRLASVPALVILILLDTLDGVVARARKEVSLMGSVLDIMLDRVVELVMWIVYADLRLIPVAIPLIYVLRGTVVDSLRSVHVREGTAPFGGLHTRLGQWLVSSPAMRSSYGVSKLVSFAGLALTHTLAGYVATGTVGTDLVYTCTLVFSFTSWVSVAFCLARGLPVILEALPGKGRG